MQGVGKTVLASFLIHSLQKSLEYQDIKVVYIYCDYTMVEKQTPLNLIADLLRQLLIDNSTSQGRLGSVRDRLRDLYKSCNHNNSRPTLIECTKLLYEAARCFSKVFIVIDALDECPEVNEVRSTLLYAIENLQSFASLLIMSRHIPNIASQLRNATRLEIKASDHDIKTYLERLRGLQNIDCPLSRERNLHVTIINTILEKVGGMFLLARLHMDSLMTKINLRQIKMDLKTLPQGLDLAYKGVMDRIDAQSAAHATLAKRLLCWLIYAVRPLRIDELQHALAVEINDTSFDPDGVTNKSLLVSVCAGMVVLQENDNLISLVHHTAKEFLVGQGAERFQNAHDEISRTCLTYLSFNEFTRASSPTNQVSWTSLFNNYPFLPYAAQHWGNHVSKSKGDDIREMALNFLQQETKMVYSIMHSFTYQYGSSGARSISRSPALQVAASFGMETIASSLINGGADVEGRSSDGWTALMVAAWNGHIGMVKLLLAEGADIESKNNDNWTALHFAGRKHQLGIMRLLLESRANIESTNNYGWTTLMGLVWNGNEAGVRLLLEKGADVNTKNHKGRTALHQVAGHGDKALARLLIENNADVAAVDTWGRTALNFALKQGHTSVAGLQQDHAKEKGIQGKNRRLSLPLYHKAEMLRCAETWRSNWDVTSGYSRAVEII